VKATFLDCLVRSMHQTPSGQPPLERRKTLMKAAVIGIAVALHARGVGTNCQGRQWANAAGHNPE